MPSIIKGFKYLFSNPSAFCDAIIKNFFRFLPDKCYLSLRYRCRMGKWIDWENPQTFTEKIQWLKIYNRRPEYVKMVDKHAVKEFVADVIGEKYIIPTLGTWESAEDIEWNSLPDQFVLKTTHGGGSCGVVICTDKNSLDISNTVSKLTKSLKRDRIYDTLKEWPYKGVQPRVIAEQFISPSVFSQKTDLIDYKFFCFNGEPLYCQVIRDRTTNETIDFYDMEWNHQEFVGLNPTVRNGDIPVERPQKLDEMKDICQKLSKDIPFIRVDLYVVDNHVYFGELTFFPASGLGSFTPEIWQYKLGELIQLPVINNRSL